ncbi:MAG: signal peptidase I [Christensenellales bacterium]
MIKKGRRAWLMEGVPGTERERLLQLYSETETYKAPWKARRAMHRQVKTLTPMQRLFRIGFNLIFWVLVAGLIALMFTAFQTKRETGIPSVFGFSVFRVETGSMVPTLPIGSFIVARAVPDPGAIEVGTIVTYRTGEGTVVTHRIIEVVEMEGGGAAYRTKGDNPINSPDMELLTPERVIGAYVLKITLPSIWGGE